MIVTVYTRNRDKGFRFHDIDKIVERKATLTGNSDWLAFKRADNDVAKFRLVEVEAVVFNDNI